MRLGAVTSLQAGEPSEAERRNGVTKRTRHLEHTQKKKNAAVRGDCIKCLHSALSMFVCLCVESQHTLSVLPSGLLCGSLVDSPNCLAPKVHTSQ